MKSFPDKKKLKKFITTKLVLFLYNKCERVFLKEKEKEKEEKKMEEE